MKIRLSTNIDAYNCTRCANCRPWAQTIAAIEGQLRAHGVSWPDFMVIHGKDLSCVAAKEGRGQKDAGLYVIATDSRGNNVRSAQIFARKDPHYVGVTSILNGTAFRKTARKGG